MIKLITGIIWIPISALIGYFTEPYIMGILVILGLFIAQSGAGGDITYTYNQRLHGLEEFKHITPTSDFTTGYMISFMCSVVILVLSGVF